MAQFPFSPVRRRLLASSGVALLPAVSASGMAVSQPIARPSPQSSSQDLATDFATAPMMSRPRIWWFWGESITTDEGITKDLEAYQRVGFGGVVLYEQVFKATPDALKSLSPEWLARVRFAAAECARLGLALEINVSNGYVAGGPWITPELGMQRLVASETLATGGKPQRIVLPQPETRLDFYRDVACLAYPSPAGSVPLPAPRLASNSADIDLVRLTTPGSRERVRIRPRADGVPVFIAFDFGTAVTVRSLSYTQRKNSKALVIAMQVPGRWGPDALGQGMRRNPPLGRLEASNDGNHWQTVVQLPSMGYQQDTWDQLTVAFAATTARHFRLNLHGWGSNQPAGDDDLLIGAVTLRGAARVDRWESKSGNVVDFADSDQTPRYGPGEVVDPAGLIDLTAQLRADGVLDCALPPGQWKILRLGHTPTGARTKHGVRDALGLECDKLSMRATRVQFDHYVGRILAAVQEVPGARLDGISVDSAEHGSQNWTADFLPQFKRRRGYDLLPYLPVMMGLPVASVEATDRILHDVRRTIADLMSDEYFGTFSALANAAGMTVTAQAPGIATCLPSDNIQAKGRVDIPMGEFWVNQFSGAGQPEGTMDCREAASAAHMYGKPVIAAEAFTGSPAHIHPAVLKPFADAAFVNGINRIVVLAGNHQPYGDRRKPGVTEDKFFLPYQRNNTWWEQSAGFWHMLGRASFLLRQGSPVVDLLYHLGSDTPLKIAAARLYPAPPDGYDFDVCGDSELLLTAVEEGKIVLPEGMRYPVLILAAGEAMTLAAVQHVESLLRAGARVIGPVRPQRMAGYADAGAERVFERTVNAVWGPQPQFAQGMRRVGAGTIVWGEPPGVHLARFSIGKDFHAPALGPLDVLCTHRRINATHVYFVANHRPVPVSFKALCRDGRGTPQAWDPMTGRRYALPGANPTVGGTLVPLQLEQHGSMFVVFGAPVPAPAGGRPLISAMRVWRAITGTWEVRFDTAWGGPEVIRIPALGSWSAHPLEGVRHYSGTAVYVKEFKLAKLPAGALWLDLGQVEVVASVFLNGHEVETIWQAPYAAEVGRYLRKGTNRLEVRVTNLWANRLIGDAALPDAQRVAWATFNPYKAEDPLHVSGLLGPVTLRM